MPPALEKSTRLVKTGALSRHGIENVRILSESRFLHLVTRMVEDSVRKRLSPAGHGENRGDDASREEETEVFILDDGLDLWEDTDDAPPRPAVESEPAQTDETSLREEYRHKWEALRSRQVSALDDIESRLESLGGVFRNMEESLSRARQESPPSPRD